jgi:hypothetical protein
MMSKRDDEELKREVVGGRIVDYFNEGEERCYIIDKEDTLYKLSINTGELKRLSKLSKKKRAEGGVKVILSGKDVTDELREVNIQEGTKRSDVVILKLKYTNGRVDTRVLLPYPLHRRYKIIFRENEEH